MKPQQFKVAQVKNGSQYTVSSTRSQQPPSRPLSAAVWQTTRQPHMTAILVQMQDVLGSMPHASGSLASGGCLASQRCQEARVLASQPLLPQAVLVEQPLCMHLGVTLSGSTCAGIAVSFSLRRNGRAALVHALGVMLVQAHCFWGQACAMDHSGKRSREMLYGADKARIINTTFEKWKALYGKQQ